MDSLADLSPLVEIEIPGCSSTIAQYGLRRAVRDFCRRTSVWQETITEDLVAEQTEYTLASVVATATIHRILSVNINAGEGSNLPAQDYEFSDNTDLVLDSEPAESETDGLVVTVALSPALVGVDFTDGAILDRWGEALAAKAIEIISKMPTYRNAELAQEKQGEYEGHVRQCLMEMHETGFKKGQAYRLAPQLQFANRR